jgi:hypothetical protein
MRQDVSALRIEATTASGAPLDRLTAGAAIQLKLFAVTSNGGSALVMGNLATWYSSNPKIAEVARTGRLIARTPGQVSISASHAGQNASIAIEVIAAPPTR